MITSRTGNVITVTLDAPWEVEVMDWIDGLYGPEHIKKVLSNLLLSKEKSMVFDSVRKEAEKQLDERKKNGIGRVSGIVR